MDPLVKDADILIGHRAREGLAEFAPRLKRIQFMGAGIDHLGLTDLLQQDRIVLTNASGVSATWIAEYILASMLLYTHRFHLTMAAQQRHEWMGFRQFMIDVGGLRDITVGMIGYGSIAREAARLCHAYNMEVLALKRNPDNHADNSWVRPGVGDPRAPSAPMVWSRAAQRTAGGERLCRDEPAADPGDPALSGAARIRSHGARRVPRQRRRGGIIDQAALIEALRTGRIAGAGLDVTDPEPLNADSPLWDMENVILTPHCSGARKNYYDVGCELFAENLRHFLSGTN